MIKKLFFELNNYFRLAAGLELKLMNAIYRAAWIENRSIGEREVLFQILKENGYDAEKLLEKAESPPIKEALFKNTESYSSKIFGVPSFFVNDRLIFGQDRLDLLQEFLFGWDGESSPSHLLHKSSL